MKPTSVDFDALLPYIGEMGRYQKVFYLLMCIPTMPAAFLAFNQVFLSAEPRHWCHVSAFDALAPNGTSDLSLAEQRRLSIPAVAGNPRRYDPCRQYDVNFTEVWYDNGMSWPEKPGEDWNSTTCQEGWDYDRSEYKNTLVTEVGQLQQTLLI